MNSERLVCVGVNHQSAPVALRERLSQWPVADLRTEQIDELVILSTCNRLEIYAFLAPTALAPTEVSHPHPTPPVQPLLDLITATQGINAAQFEDHLYQFTGEAVVKHLCQVAAGLDSIVMGEGQILGQVNNALQQAYAVKSVGQILALLFRIAIKAGKRARTETRIGAYPVSISSAAVALAGQVTGDLRTKIVAVVGLGEMGQLALKGLRGRGVTDLLLLNRTQARAEALATTYRGRAMPLAQLPEALRTADLLITATSAVTPIIDRAMVATALAERANRPLTLIDLAVPRNIGPLVKTPVNQDTVNQNTVNQSTVTADEELPVSLFDVDDMRSVVHDAFSARHAEVPQVHRIIDEQLVAWREQMQALQVRPVVVGLRQQAEQIRQQAVKRTMRYLERQQGAVDEATAEQLAHLSRILVNQLLHTPTVTLKAKSQAGDGATYAALICELFGLDIPLPTDELQPSFAFNWLLADGEDAEQGTYADEHAANAPFATLSRQDQYELVGQP